VSNASNMPNMPNASCGSASAVRSMPTHVRPYPSSHAPRKYSSEHWRCELEGSWRQTGKDDKGTTKGTCPTGSWRST
jgi:hypothetical protein